MNIQNSVGAVNYNSFGFKGSKNTEVKKAITKIKNISDMQDSQQKTNALKEIAAKLLGLFQKTEPKTIHFNDAYKMYQESIDFAWGQQIYKKVIDRCLKDIDTALETGKPKAEVDKLFDTLEIFTTKYGHYGT